jgi:hypothetical protein
MSFFNLLCGLILEGFKTTVETQLTTGTWEQAVTLISWHECAAHQA